MWTAVLGTRRLVSEATKKQVAASQAWRCSACTLLLPAAFQVDHVMPLAVGGSNDMSNLSAMCPNCHAAKTQAEDERVRAFRAVQSELRGTSGAACWHCGAVYSTYFRHFCAVKP